MNALSDDQNKANRKRFWSLTIIVLASIGSFAVAVFGVVYGMLGAIGGAISVGVMPWAGDQVLERMDETSFIANLAVIGGIVGGLFFLVLFIRLRRRPE